MPYGILVHPVPEPPWKSESLVAYPRVSFIFSALLPADDPSYEFGVPEYHPHIFRSYYQVFS